MPTELRRRRRSRGSVCEIEPWSGHLRKYSAFLASSYPSPCLTVNQLFPNLHHLVNIFSHCRVDHDKSRAATEADGCFLFVQLSVRKGFRSIVNIELREMIPNRLALPSLCGRQVRVTCKIQSRHSLALVYFLLMEHLSIDFAELCTSSISQNQLFMRDGILLSGNLRLIDYSSKKLMDTLRSPVTTLYMLEIMSVYFSNVGVRVRCKLFVKFVAPCTLIFPENWIDVPEAEALIHYCYAHHGTSKAYIDELFATVDSCYVLDDLVRHNAAIDELVLSRRARCTYRKPQGFATCFSAVSDRCSRIKTFEICDFELNNTDLRDFQSGLNGSVKMQRPNVTCTAAAAGLQFFLGLFILSKATLAEIQVSSCLAPVHHLCEITKEIGGHETLKKLSLSQVYRSGDTTLWPVDTLKVNLTEGFLRLGTEKQPGLANFSKQIGVRGRGSGAEFEGFYAVIDSLSAYLRKGRKTWQATFEAPVPLSWPQFNKPTSRPCGNAYLTRLAVRMATVIDCNLAVRLSVFAGCGYQREAPLALATETSPSMTLVSDIGKSRSLCSLISSGWTFYHAATTLSGVLCTTSTPNHLVSTAVLQQSGVFPLIKLSGFLVTYYTVLSWMVYKQRDCEQNVRDPSPTNLPLLQDAWWFVMPPCCNSKRAALGC
ncbi:uncharacterized protein [Dermacentor albipictus]|uniref:uncharacterized protein n=1 Tax=Dermacentor albipictus TaxID=60249 RepID=UPI0038FC05F0